MLTILVHILIVALVLGLVVWLFYQIPFVQPYGRIVGVACLVIFVIWIILTFLGIH